MKGDRGAECVRMVMMHVAGGHCTTCRSGRGTRLHLTDHCGNLWVRLTPEICLQMPHLLGRRGPAHCSPVSSNPPSFPVPNC